MQRSKASMSSTKESLVELISNLKNAINLKFQWEFVQSGTINKKCIQEIEPGKVFQFMEKRKCQVVYGNSVLKNGVHTWTLKLDLIKPLD